jgi:phosphoadenosine phosphosulfate reductase
MRLKRKINKSKQVIRKALGSFDKGKLGVAWTGGKDSTVLLHLVREVCGGEVELAVMFNDSTMEFEEVYELVDRLEKEWGLNLIRIVHPKRKLKKVDSEKIRELKIEAIEKAVKEHGLEALMAGIRWDEHRARAKEKYFSPRKDHMRIHPLLHFTEKNIWEYIKKFKVPYVSLYDKGYRSLGEKPFTRPAKKKGKERSGREADKEEVMERLRALGYW